jgi:aldose sugar dehydrogenase
MSRPSAAALFLAALPLGLVASAAPLGAQAGVVDEVGSVSTEAGPVVIERLADGLDHPWGMTFLPDGRLLLTERAGAVRILDGTGTLSDPLDGAPEVFAEGQGGMLDVALHPEFEQNGLVYLSFAHPGPEGMAATALGRGRLSEGRITGFEVLFTQEPWIDGANHFGGRIVFSGDGHLFLTLGERFQFDPAQDLSDHLGTIVRLSLDGSVPDDNPFVGRSGPRAEIWSYGHRNVESAATHPETGELWIAEMGPLGGDELNRPAAGANHGWPAVSWGRHYDGETIPDPPTRPELADAVKQWTPVISPSGMTAYSGDVFDEWRGDMLIGSLSQTGIIRLDIQDGAVAHEELIPLNARIRDVEQAPDGTVYVLTDQDDGDVWRLSPIR